MSAQLLALAGVVLGAILAGAGNLLLAWRDETIQARTGVYLIRRVLEEAEKEVRRLRGEKHPRWNPEQLPDGRLWADYRAPVSARLALARLQKIDEAMRELDKLNEAAARARKLGDDLEARIYQAAERGDATAQAELESEPRPDNLSEPAITALPEIEKTIQAALEELLAAAPSGLPGRSRNRRAFMPWYRLHWRSFAALGISACLVVGFFLLTAPGTSPVTAVQEDLAAHFGDPAFASCEAVNDHEGAFSCVVVEKTMPTPCGKIAARPSSRSLFASEVATGAPATKCGGFAQARTYTARRQHSDECTAFLETGIANVPTGANPSSPGFLRRMKALLRRDSGGEGELPPVIVPGSAFTADC